MDFTIFSTREWAIISWAIIILLIFLIKGKIRLLYGFVELLFQHSVIWFIFFQVVIYSIVFLIFFTKGLNFEITWNILKDIIIWISITCFSLCAKSIRSDSPLNYKTVIKSITFSSILSFLIDNFTFPFLIEMILQPVIVILSLFIIIADKKSEYQLVKKTSNYILTIFGVMLIVYVIYNIFISYKNVLVSNFWEPIIIELILSICYLPLFFLFWIESKISNFLVNIDDSLKKTFFQKVKLIILFFSQSHFFPKRVKKILYYEYKVLFRKSTSIDEVKKIMESILKKS